MGWLISRRLVFAMRSSVPIAQLTIASPLSPTVLVIMPPKTRFPSF